MKNIPHVNAYAHYFIAPAESVLYVYKRDPGDAEVPASLHEIMVVELWRKRLVDSHIIIFPLPVFEKMRTDRPMVMTGEEG